MGYFGAHAIAPRPNVEDAPFWEHCAERRLTFQKCRDCGMLAHPPIGVCPRCQSTSRVWAEPAVARVYSFTWIHTAADDSVAQALPYNVAVVEFPELPGVRLVTNVMDAKLGELAIGDAVTLAWDPIDDGMFLPRFLRDKG
jgi:uncharacterized OB-fold protein